MAESRVARASFVEALECLAAQLVFEASIAECVAFAYFTPFRTRVASVLEIRLWSSSIGV